MRFFSNDARESTDEQARDERPERVQSDPVAVPNQRPPSPWSDKPGPTYDKGATGFGVRLLDEYVADVLER